MNRLFLFAIVVVALMGCAGSQAQRPISMQAYEGPVDIGALRSAMALQSVPGLSSEIKAKIYRGGERLGGFTGALLWEPQDHWALELHSPFGSTVFIFTRNDGEVSAFLPQEGVLYKGKLPALGPDVPGAQYEMAEDGSVVRLRLLDQRGALSGVYEYDVNTLNNTAIIAMSNEHEVMRMEFDSFQSGLPMGMSFSFPNGYRLELALVDPEVIEEIAEDAFEIRRNPRETLSIEALVLPEELRK